MGCKHGCWYCYAKKLTQRFKKIFPNGFEPTFHPERLTEPWTLKKPSKIFVCSIADLFACWTPQIWRERVWESMLFCPVKHTFQLLTKNPENIPKNVIYPNNFWFGTTVTNEQLVGEIPNDSSDWDGPVNIDVKNIVEIKKVKAGVRFVSFEPLLGPLPEDVSLKGIDWVIVGKLTGSRKVPLNFEWLTSIIDKTADLGIPLFLKNNLGLTRKMQQFPDLPKLLGETKP